MKVFIQYLVIVLFTILGGFIGHYTAVNILPNIGANFITVKDVIGCYLLSIGICFFIGAYIGAVYLEDKL